MVRKRKTLQTIKDHRLEPFFITVDDYCFTVKEKITPDSDHFKSNGRNKIYEKSLFYLPNLGKAIEKIAELKSGDGDFDNLNDYLFNYENIKNQIKEYTDEFRSLI